MSLQRAKQDVIDAVVELIRFGYDGPFMGEAVEPLFKAVREMQRKQKEVDDKEISFAPESYDRAGLVKHAEDLVEKIDLGVSKTQMAIMGSEVRNAFVPILFLCAMLLQEEEIDRQNAEDALRSANRVLAFVEALTRSAV